MKRVFAVFAFCMMALGFWSNVLAAEPSISDEEMLGAAQTVYESRDCRLVFQTFSELAEKGDAAAMAWLGRCYLNGVGTERNEAEAFRCFSQAATKKEPWALNGLGVCYRNGYGTTVNIQEALRCYQEAPTWGFRRRR